MLTGCQTVNLQLEMNMHTIHIHSELLCSYFMHTILNIIIIIIISIIIVIRHQCKCEWERHATKTV